MNAKLYSESNKGIQSDSDDIERGQKMKHYKKAAMIIAAADIVTSIYLLLQGELTAAAAFTLAGITIISVANKKSRL